jgi:hypothetical protein
LRIAFVSIGISTIFRLSGAPVLCGAQPFSKTIEICQPARCKQPIDVLLKPAIARLREPEFELDDADHTLNRRAYTRLAAIACLLGLVHDSLALRTLVCTIAGIGGVGLDGITLPLKPQSSRKSVVAKSSGYGATNLRVAVLLFVGR